MIPKIIHLIWIGDKPPYLDNVIESYHKVNPDFIMNPMIYRDLYYNDPVLKMCIDIYVKAFNRDDPGQNGIYRQLYRHYDLHISNFGFRRVYSGRMDIHRITKQQYPIICDGIRFVILYMFGGIYVDCDTLPAKPFDERLMQMDEFQTFRDIFFLGTKTNNIFWFVKDHNMRDRYEHVNQLIQKQDFDNETISKFLSGNLQYSNNSTSQDHYINHYRQKSWKIEGIN